MGIDVSCPNCKGHNVIQGSYSLNLRCPDCLWVF